MGQPFEFQVWAVRSFACRPLGFIRGASIRGSFTPSTPAGCAAGAPAPFEGMAAPNPQLAVSNLAFSGRTKMVRTPEIKLTKKEWVAAPTPPRWRTPSPPRPAALCSQPSPGASLSLSADLYLDVLNNSYNRM
jgi:hypothetical protein